MSLCSARCSIYIILFVLTMFRPTDGIIPILPMKFRKIKSLAQGKADKAFRPQRPLEARGFLR